MKTKRLRARKNVLCCVEEILHRRSIRIPRPMYIHEKGLGYGPVPHQYIGRRLRTTSSTREQCHRRGEGFALKLNKTWCVNRLPRVQLCSLLCEAQDIQIAL